MNRIVVVGGGQAGGSLVDHLRKLGFEGEVHLVCAECEAPYHRPPLSKKFLAGTLPRERLAFRPPPLFARLGVDLIQGCPATAIDREGRQVVLDDGRELPYDGLALATGARVRNLPFGDELQGVHTLRTIADAESLAADAAAHGGPVVVIGGGFIGLEVAATLTGLGLSVSVVEMAPRLLPRGVSAAMAERMAALHLAAGVHLELGRGVTGFGGASRVESVRLDDGRELPAALAVVGIGVTAETSLAESAGLACDDGIVVDEFARTDDPAIVAAGDCTRHPGADGRLIRLESVQNATEQARTAAATLVGRHEPYRQVPWFWTDQYHVKLQMAGLSDPCDEPHVLYEAEGDRLTLGLFRQGLLCAVETLNHPADHMAARKLLHAGHDIRLEQATAPGFSLIEAARRLT